MPPLAFDAAGRNHIAASDAAALSSLRFVHGLCRADLLSAALDLGIEFDCPRPQKIKSKSNVKIEVKIKVKVKIKIKGSGQECPLYTVSGWVLHGCSLYSWPVKAWCSSDSFNASSAARFKQFAATGFRIAPTLRQCSCPPCRSHVDAIDGLTVGRIGVANSPPLSARDRWARVWFRRRS